jgi:SAM-dependent methyltransferase
MTGGRTIGTHREFWNHYAPVYDERTRVDRYLRTRNLRILTETFSPGDRLIEIGCGTGTEAAAMTEYGCRLTLTDISLDMLKIASGKLNGNGVFINLPAESIDCLMTEFDGGYSSFGVLNCLGRLPGFFMKLSGILKPGSFFVASVINRLYWEDFLYYLSGATNYFINRVRGYGHVTFNGMRTDVIINYYSVRQLRNAARPYFSVSHCYALPVFLPPPYTNPAEKLPGWLFGAAEKIDSILYRKFPFNRFGEQSVVVFQRSEESTR